MLSTSQSRGSATVVVMMTERRYSGRLVDNPLWFGLTLLAGIVLAAGVVVCLRRQTTKLLRRWTCDVTASCCCRCYRKCAHAATADDSSSSVDVGWYTQEGMRGL